MPRPAIRTAAVLAVLAAALTAAADDHARHERHELMESAGDAAKTVVPMLRGEAEFDADALMASLETWLDVSESVGALFPADPDTGDDTRAAPAIWEDRAGFDEALAEFGAAVEAAVDAAPASLEDAKPVVQPVLGACKNCHDDYRLEED